MLIRVKYQEKPEAMIFAIPNTLIQDLRNTLERFYNVDRALQMIYFGETQLQDGHTLSYYNIESGSVLELTTESILNKHSINMEIWNILGNIKLYVKRGNEN